MSRRTVSSVLVVVLLAALIAVAAFLPVPYVTMSPGPTVDVLAKYDGDQVIQVDGHETFETEGDLRLTTVSVTSPGVEINLLEALSAWFDGTRAVYPRDVIYPPEQSVEEHQRESTVQMTSDPRIPIGMSRFGFRAS